MDRGERVCVKERVNGCVCVEGVWVGIFCKRKRERERERERENF